MKVADPLTNLLLGQDMWSHCRTSLQTTITQFLSLSLSRAAAAAPQQRFTSFSLKKQEIFLGKQFFKFALDRTDMQNPKKFQGGQNQLLHIIFLVLHAL